jgi:hypothetical protein
VAPEGGLFLVALLVLMFLLDAAFWRLRVASRLP